MGRKGRVSGSCGASGFSGEGEEAGREGLLKVESGALRQHRQGQRQQTSQQECCVPAVRQQAMTRVLSAMNPAKAQGGTLKTNPSPWKQAAGVA